MFKILWVQVEKTKLIETSKGHTIERHNNAHRHGHSLSYDTVSDKLNCPNLLE